MVDPLMMILILFSLIFAMIAIALFSFWLGYSRGREAKVLCILDRLAEGSRDGNNEAASK